MPCLHNDYNIEKKKKPILLPTIHFVFFPNYAFHISNQNCQGLREDGFLGFL